jgi:hypothetical protein
MTSSRRLAKAGFNGWFRYWLAIDSVAGKDYYVRVGLGWLKVRELRVQVTQDVKFHYNVDGLTMLKHSFRRTSNFKHHFRAGAR